jgi:5,10-methylenetetrahydrofolate reductase
VRHQVGVLAPIAHGFLIPDNHLGRATVSSIAVAHEVAGMGVKAIACLNSRDRNRLGFRRDLLTAAAYGVDQFLCVFGDQPSRGAGRPTSTWGACSKKSGRSEAQRHSPATAPSPLA